MKFEKLISDSRVIIIISVLLAIGFGTILLLKSNGGVKTIKPAEIDLVRVVKISGKVVPIENVDLGFEVAGIVSSVRKNVGQNVNKGDILAELDRNLLITQVAKARAELDSATAELLKLNGANNSETSISAGKRVLIQTLLDAYSLTEEAIYSKTDQFFINPNSARPEILYALKGYDPLREIINNSRSEMGEILESWKSKITGLNLTTYSNEILSLSKNHLQLVSSYLSNVSRAVNLFESSSSLTQSTIDKYKNDVALARDDINRIQQTIITEESKLNALTYDIPALEAGANVARANLLNSESQLLKTVLASPVSGIVSRQDAKIGQVVAIGEGVVSIISPDLMIEAFVPEILFAGLSVGNSANVVLDAYGSETIFHARIVHIDPAEIVRDGVSTYRIKLSFDDSDSRLRSGMTANLEIETFRKHALITIPERVVSRDELGAYVFILNDRNKEIITRVMTGERDSRGNIEIVSGLSLLDQVIVDPPAKKLIENK
jgi:RND family efflux transporter MFP subunit